MISNCLKENKNIPHTFTIVLDFKNKRKIGLWVLQIQTLSVFKGNRSQYSQVVLPSGLRKVMCES